MPASIHAYQLLRWRNILVDIAVSHNTRRRQCGVCRNTDFGAATFRRRSGVTIFAASNSPKAKHLGPLLSAP